MLNSIVSALPILPVRLQTSIFGRNELNFRVRNGNGWTLAVIDTNCLFSLPKKKVSKEKSAFLSLPPSSRLPLFGDPWESRTPVWGVRGPRLDHLTNGPRLVFRIHYWGRTRSVSPANKKTCCFHSRFFVLASTYVSGPSPVKYFRHVRA